MSVQFALPSSALSRTITCFEVQNHPPNGMEAPHATAPLGTERARNGRDRVGVEWSVTHFLLQALDFDRVSLDPNTVPSDVAHTSCSCLAMLPGNAPCTRPLSCHRSHIVPQSQLVASNDPFQIQSDVRQIDAMFGGSCLVLHLRLHRFHAVGPSTLSLLSFYAGTRTHGSLAQTYRPTWPTTEHTSPYLAFPTPPRPST